MHVCMLLRNFGNCSATMNVFMLCFKLKAGKNIVFHLIYL